MKKPPKFDGTQHCVAPSAAAAAAYAGDSGSSPAAAKLLCRGCTFLDSCRSYALTEDVHGVWGGLTFEERHRERARLGLDEPTSIGHELDQIVAGWRAAAAGTAALRSRTRRSVTAA